MDNGTNITLLSCLVMKPFHQYLVWWIRSWMQVLENPESLQELCCYAWNENNKFHFPLSFYVNRKFIETELVIVQSQLCTMKWMKLVQQRQPKAWLRFQTWPFVSYDLIRFVPKFLRYCDRHLRCFPLWRKGGQPLPLECLIGRLSNTDNQLGYPSSASQESPKRSNNKWQEIAAD